MEALDQLEGLAIEADTGAKALDPVDPNAPPPPAVIDYAQEARGLVDMLGALITGYAPACGPLWNESTKGRIAEAAAPVMVKYNFSIGGMPPELVLLVVAGPVLYQSSKIVAKQMNEDRKTAPVVEDAKAKPVTAAPTDTPEAPTSPQTALYPS